MANMAKMNAEFAQLSVGDGAANKKAKEKQEEEEEQQGKVDLLTFVTNSALELGKDSEDPEKAANYQLLYELALSEKRREEKRKNPVKVTKHTDILELLSNTKDSDGDDIYFTYETSDDDGEYEMPSENEDDDYDDGVDDEEDDEERVKEYEKWLLAKIESEIR